jgi:hypothetical protein
VRPPPQSAVQAKALAETVKHAKEQSEKAKVGLLQHLDTRVRQGLHVSLQNLSAAELLDRLTWEIQHLPIIHNGPAVPLDPKAPFASSGGGLNTSMSQGYIENVCQAVVMGGKPQFSVEYQAELEFMVRFMHIPADLKKHMLAGDATMRQADNCVQYLCNNLQKKAGGNFVYGPITYVMNLRSKSKWAVSAYDSGAFFGLFGAKYGTHEHFYHLVQPNERVLGIDWSRIMNRWWVPEAPVPKGFPSFNSYPYFEYNHFGALQLPEDILYISMKFSSSHGATGFWGKELGAQAQDFLLKHKRPLVWADSEDSGMIIDPVVGHIHGDRIRPEDIALFKKQWAASTSFADLYKAVPAYLRLHYPSWENRAACEHVESSSDNMVLGVDGDGKCVYWEWISQESKYECSLDGVCFKSTSERAVYASQAECDSRCGKGKWSCIRTTQVPSGASHYCEPDANGTFANLEECELGVSIGPGVRVGQCSSPWASNHQATDASNSTAVQKMSRVPTLLV